VLPALAALVVYVPALSGGFLSDDYSQLEMFHGASAGEVAARAGRTFVSGIGPPSNQYRPLTMASFAANTLASGADPVPWRLTNVLLHAANASLVAFLSWQLAASAARGVRTAAVAAGVAFAWFAPSAEAVAWISARFDGMALFWMLVAACAYMASREWRDRYGILSLAATVLAFLSKESAAIGPALIVALGWVKRPERERLARGIAATLAASLPWLLIGAAYFAYRMWLFGDPFRFYPGTSPGAALLSGQWLAALSATIDWWPRALPEDGARHVFTLAGVLICVAAVSAGLANRHEGRVLVALAAALVVTVALLFSHWTWSITGEGGRVLYAPAAIAALIVALPLRASLRRLRAASWLVFIALVGSSLVLARGAVDRRVAAGAEMLALVSALAKVADATPAGSYAFVIVPDRIGSIPFARNAQGGLISPPVQPRPLSGRLMVQLEDALPRWQEVFEQNALGAPRAAPGADAGALSLPAVPDRFYCWSTRRHELVALPLVFAPRLRDWNEVWAKGIDAAGCRP